jgi:hypothetical protein
MAPTFGRPGVPGMKTRLVWTKPLQSSRFGVFSRTRLQANLVPGIGTGPR